MRKYLTISGLILSIVSSYGAAGLVTGTLSPVPGIGAITFTSITNALGYLPATNGSVAASFTNFTFYVDPLGNDANNGSLMSPWATPGKATATVRITGSKIIINPGTYYLTTNNLRVFAGVSVFGTRGQSVIIYPGGAPALSAWGLGLSNNTIVDGITIYTTNSASVDQSQPIVDLAANPTNEIRFCEVYGPFDALYSQPSGFARRYWHDNKLSGSFDTMALTGGDAIIENNLIMITNMGYSSQSRGLFVGAPGATTTAWVNNNTFIIEDNFSSNSVAYGIDVRGGSILQLGNNQYFIVSTNPTVSIKSVFITGGTVINRGSLPLSDIGRALSGALAKIIDPPFGGFSGIALGITNVTAAYTLISNIHFVNIDTSGGAVNVTLDYITNFPTSVPRISSGNSVGGYFCTIKNMGANAMNIIGSGADTIDGLAGYTNSAQYSSVTLGIKTNGQWVVYGAWTPTIAASNFWSVIPAFPAATQSTNWAINFGQLNSLMVPANEQALTTATNVFMTGPTNWYVGASMSWSIYASGATVQVFIPTNVCGQLNNSDWTVLSTNYYRWLTNGHAIHFTLKSNVQWMATSVYPLAGQ